VMEWTEVRIGRSSTCRICAERGAA